MLLSLFGLCLMGVLLAWGSRAALLVGMLATAVVGIPLGLVTFQGVVSVPPSIAPTLLKLDLRGLASAAGLSVMFVFFFLALFDTIGTLVGLGAQAGLLRDGRLPRAGKALLSDAAGMSAGALLGTSSITSYVESAAGIAAGGRTGLASIVTAGLFLLALCFHPLAGMIGARYLAADGTRLYPVIAPVLILIGSFMLRGLASVEWKDPTEAIPAFLTALLMPMTLSITDGIAFGLIAYCALKVAAGRWREVHWMIGLSAAALLLRYVVE